jgi:hypothetical protein
MLLFEYCHRWWNDNTGGKLHRDTGRVCFDDVVGEVDEELSQASFGGRVVTQYGGEGSVAQWFGETLA